MNDTEKIKLITEAVKDKENGGLDDFTFFEVVADIVAPRRKITMADIERSYGYSYDH